MDPWTIFWIVLALMAIWWFRYFIVIGVVAFCGAVAALCIGGVALIFSMFESRNERRHRKKYRRK